MTITAGFCCFDGVVLCSDSECVSGQSRFYDKKIFRADAHNCTVFLTGAGDYSLIRATSEEVAASLAEKTVSLDQVKAVVESAVSDIYQHHVTASKLAGDVTSSMALLLAVKMRARTKAMLFRVSETGSLSQISEGYTVLGTEAAESVMRELADLLFRDYAISVFDMRHMAPDMVRRVIRFATFCGGSPQVACLADNTMAYFNNDASSEPGPDSLSAVLTDLPDIFASIYSGKPCTERLSMLRNRVESAIEERRRILGGFDPFEVDGWDW